MRGLTPDEMALIATRLRSQRAELMAQRETTRDSRAPVELDQASVGRLSRMDAIQVQAMALAAEQRRLDGIGRIDQALTRLEDGSFGECIVCGDPIAPKRLELDPAIATCIACAGR